MPDETTSLKVNDDFGVFWRESFSVGNAAAVHSRAQITIGIVTAGLMNFYAKCCVVQFIYN